MTITLTWASGAFDPYTRDQASMFKKLAFAFLGVGTAAERATAQAEVLKQPDFKAEIQTTTDTSDLEALDLTTEGVTFPARTMRDITLKSWCMTDNDTYFYETVETVLGGTTPVLLGQKIVTGWGEEAGTALEYGDVHFSATITALTTLTTIFASKGISMADITSGDADLTVPKNRVCNVKYAGLSQPSAITASTTGYLVAVDPAVLADGAGTDAVSFLNSTGTVVTALSPALGGIVSLAFELWPPFNHRLVMDSNNVTVKCTAVAAIGDENLKHYVEVFVGPARTIGYSAV